MKCLFTYADGRGCAGTIYRARAYGRNKLGIVARRDIKKIRLWCDLKDDHAGIHRSFKAKLRMEFYPNDLGELYAEAVELCENVKKEGVSVWSPSSAHHRHLFPLSSFLWPHAWRTG